MYNQVMLFVGLQKPTIVNFVMPIWMKTQLVVIACPIQRLVRDFFCLCCRFINYHF